MNAVNLKYAVNLNALYYIATTMLLASLGRKRFYYKAKSCSTSLRSYRCFNRVTQLRRKGILKVRV